MITRSIVTSAIALFSFMPVLAQQDSIVPGMQDTTTLDTENQRLQGTTLMDEPEMLQDDPEREQREREHMELATKDEGSWIGIKGTVTMVGDKSFILGYDGGTVAVALGGETLREHQFIKDQSVTVYGRVDNSFFDQKVIKARVVVVDGLQPTQHLVIGEGDAIRVLTASHVPGTVVHGRVTNLSGRNITLEKADGKITVDTSTLSYDPAKAEGHMRVEVGDIVTAQGLIRSDFWTGRTLKATSLDVIKYGQLDQPSGDENKEGEEQVQPTEGGMDGSSGEE